MNGGRTQSSSRYARAGLAALVLVGLLVLVAIGARGSHPLGHARVQQRYVPQRVGNDLFTLFVIVLGLGAVLFVAGLYAIRDEWHERLIYLANGQCDTSRNLIDQVHKIANSVVWNIGKRFFVVERL